jgi:hypothetical protein
MAKYKFLVSCDRKNLATLFESGSDVTSAGNVFLVLLLPFPLLLLSPLALVVLGAQRHEQLE